MICSIEDCDLFAEFYIVAEGNVVLVICDEHAQAGAVMKEKVKRLP